MAAPTRTQQYTMESHQQYVKDHVNPILESLVTALLLKKPNEPIAFMLEWLADQVPDAVPKDNGPMSCAVLRKRIDQMRKRCESLSDLQQSAAEASVSASPDAEPKDEEEAEEEEEEEDDDDDVIDDAEQERMMAMMKTKTQRGSVSAEAYGAWNQKKEYVAPVHPKDEEQEAAIRKVLGGSFMFQALGQEALATVVGAMLKVDVPAGDTVIKQGDDGDFLFVVEQGTLECVKKSGDEEAVVKTCAAGDAFGELALLYNCPRAASVRAVDPCVLWKLDRDTFSNVVQGAAQKSMERRANFIKECPLLQGLAMYEQMKLCECLKIVEFAEEDTVITEGKAGDSMFFVESGTCVAKKALVPDVLTDMMEHKPGDYFGELCLLKAEPRAATVIAREATVCFELDRSNFKTLLGPIQDVVMRQTARYDK